MFESLVTTILKRVAGQYLQNVSSEKLSLGIWSGNVELRDLALRGDALDELGLPIHVRAGYVESITLSIPWKELKTKPVTAKVSGVYVYVTPKTLDEEPTEEEQKENSHNGKMKKIALSESDVVVEDKNDEQSAGTMGNLVNVIIDNLQMVVEHVHIRFEDDVSSPSKPFAFGVTMERISAESTDKNWNKSFVVGETIVHKLAKLSRLSVYLDTGSLFRKIGGNVTDLAAAIAREDNNPVHEYIVSPLSATFHLRQNKSQKPDMLIPQLVAELSLSSLDVALAEAQYHSLMGSASMFANFGSHAKYSGLRPSVPVRGEYARQWWHYAYKAVLIDVREHRKQWSWSSVLKSQKNRRQYMELYGAQLMGQDVDEKAMVDLECDLTFDELRLYRAITRSRVKERKPRKAKKKQGWGDWIRRKAVEEEVVDEGDIAVAMTDDELLAFYDLAGLDENGNPIEESQDVTQPSDWVKMSIQLELGVLRVNLKAGDRMLVGLEMSTTRVKMDQLVEAMRINVGVGGLQVTNLWNQDTDFPLLLTGRQTNDLISATVQTFPLGSEASSSVVVTMEPIDIVYDHVTVDRLMEFFSLGLEEQLLLSNVGTEAAQQFETAKKETETSIAHALETRIPPIDLDMKIGSPTIIVPADTRDKDAPVVVLVLGSMAMTSVLGTDDAAYDVYTLALSGIQGVVVPSVSDWNRVKAMEEERNKLRVIHPFDITLDVGVSIVPEDLNRSIIRIRGHLACLSLQVSIHTLNSVLSVLSSIAPPGSAEQPIPIMSTPTEDIDGIILNLEAVPKKEEDPEYLLAKAKQALVAVSINVDQVKVVVGGQRDLVALSVDGVEAQFTQRQYDMKLCAAVSSIIANDCLVPASAPVEFKQMVSCVRSDSNSISLDLSILGKESPDYVDADTLLNMDASKLIVRLNRVVVAEVLDLVSQLDFGSGDEQVPVEQIAQSSQATSFRAKFRIDGVTAVLNASESSDERYAMLESSIGGMAVCVDVGNDLDVAGHVGSLSVRDLTASDSLYRDIVHTVDAEHQLDFRYQQYASGASDLHARMALLEVVFLMNVVDSIVEYFGKFSEFMADDQIVGTITNTVGGASRDAAEAIQASEAAQQMGLDVIILSPTVIIPRTAASDEVLVADLGTVTVTSKLEGTNNHISSKVTGINIRASKIKGKDRLINDLAVGAEVMIGPALVDVSASLSDMSMVVSEDAYALVLNVLFDNILGSVEIQPDEKPSVLSEAEPTTAKKYDVDEESTLTRDTKLYAPRPSIQQHGRDDEVSVRVQFDAEKIGLELLSTNDSLAILNIVGIDGKLNMWDDGAMETVVGIESLCINDNRSGAPNHINQILSHGGLDKHFRLSYVQQADEGDAFLDVVVSRPIFSVVPSQVQSLIQFAMGPLQERDAALPSEEDIPAPPSKSSFYIAASITEAELRLVEDDQADTVMVMRASLAAAYDMLVGGRWQADARISDVQMLVKVAESQGVNLLAPISFDAQAKGDDLGSLLAIARLGDIDVSWSYRDLVAALNIGTALGDAVMKGLSSEVEQQPVQDNRTEVYKPPPGLEQQIYVVCDTLVARIIDDCLGSSQDMPVLESRLSQVNARLCDWSTHLVSSADFTVAVEYFNRIITAWEPFVEPVRINSSFVMPPRKPSEAKLEAAETLNINVTSALVTGLISTLSTWEEDYNRKSTDSRSAFSPFWIDNQTELPLSCSEHGSDKWITVESCSRHPAPINVTRGSAMQRERRRTLAHRSVSRIGNVVGVGAKFVDVKMDEATFTVPINQIGTTLSHKRVLCDVSIVEGSYVLTVATLARLNNCTSSPLDIWVCNKEGKYWVVRGLGPGKHVFAPLEIASDARVALTLASDVSDTPRFTVDKDCAQQGWIALSIEKTVHEIVWGTDGDKRMYMAALLEAEYIDDIICRTLTLSPPIVLENLLCCEVNVEIHGLDQVITLAPGAVKSIYDHDDSAVDMSFVPVGFTSVDTISVEAADISTTFKVRDASKKKVELMVDVKTDENGTRRVSVSVMSWLRNATGLPITFGVPKGITTKTAAGQDGRQVHQYIDPTMWRNVFIEGYPGHDPPEMLLYSEKNVRLRVGDSPYSDRIPLRNPGIDGGIIIKEDLGPKGHTLYDIGVWISMVDASKSLTRLVTLVPRYIFANQTDVAISVAQHGVESAMRHPIEIDAGKQQSIASWPDATMDRMFSVRLEGTSIWSGGIDVGEVGEMPIMFGSDVYRVEVRSHSGFILVMVCSIEDEASATYSIHNNSDVPIFVSQHSEETEHRIDMGDKLMWGWENPTGKRKIRVKSEDNSSKSISPDILGKKKKLSVHGADHPITVQAEGPTHVVAVGRCVQAKKEAAVEETSSLHTSMFAAVLGGLGSSGGIDEEEEEEYVPLIVDDGIKLSLNLPGFGVSIVDRTQEILYLKLSDVQATLSSNDKETGVQVSIAGIQADNQDPDAHFPVILAPSTTRRSDMRVLEASLVKSNMYSGVDYIRLFSIALQPLDLKASDQSIGPLLVAINDIIDAATPVTETDVSLTSVAAQSRLLSQESVPRVGKTVTSSQRVYCEMLVIQPLRLNVTFSLSGMDLKKKKVRITDVFGGFLRTIGTTVLNIENAPLRLNALVVENANAAFDALINRLIAHYTRQAIEEAYKILGSFEFIGNPVGLVGNLGTGVMDFFVEPAQGAMESPAAFAEGLAKGTGSLLSKSVYGVFDAASKVTGSASRGFAAMSADEEYNRRRRKGQGPRHAGEGLLMGARDLGIGLFEGVTGVVTQPIKGAEAEGVSGFFKGLGRGIVGVAAKPVTGVLDFATQTLGGIRNTMTVFDPIVTRVRPPRVMYPSGPLNRLVLRVYSLEEATGHHLMHQAGPGASESWVLHADVDKGRAVLLSTHRLIYLDDDGDVIWAKPLSELVDVSASRMNFVGVFKSSEAKSFLGIDRGTSKCEAIVSDPKLMQWLVRRLGQEIHSDH